MQTFRIFAVAALCWLALGSSSESTARAETHSELMARIHNELRAASGLPPQAVDAGLSNVAQHWAEVMASRGSMFHGGGEQIIAYSGGDTSYQAGFRLWQNSSPHLAWLRCQGPACGFGYATRGGVAYYAGAFSGSPGGGVSASTTVTSSRRRGRFIRREWFWRRG